MCLRCLALHGLRPYLDGGRKPLPGVLGSRAEGCRGAPGVSPYTAGAGTFWVPEGTRSGPLGLQWTKAEPRPPSAEGGTPFRRAHFTLTCLRQRGLRPIILFEREKERWKPCALCRGRHPGRGAAGLLVTNGGQPFGAEKPDGPVPGGRTGYPSKTSQWDVFESTEAKALGFVLVGARLVPGLCFLAAAGTRLHTLQGLSLPSGPPLVVLDNFVEFDCSCYAMIMEKPSCNPSSGVL